MRFVDDVPDAKRRARQALAALLDNGLAPTPEAFAVFYALAMGSTKLAARIDEIGGGKIDQTLIADLYRDFIQIPSPEGEISEKLLDFGEILESGVLINEAIAADLVELAAAGARLNEAVTAQVVPADLLEAQFEIISRMEAQTGKLARKLHAAQENITTLASEMSKRQEDALRDPITGLWTFPFLMSELGRRRRTAKLEQIGVICLKICNLSEINQKYSASSGDAILLAAAKLVNLATRAQGINARLYGASFVMVFEHMQRRPLGAKADLLRQTIKQWNRSVLGAQPGRLSRPKPVFGLALDTIDRLDLDLERKILTIDRLASFAI